MTRREQIADGEGKSPFHDGTPNFTHGFISGAEWADANSENQVRITEFFDKQKGTVKTIFEFVYENDFEEFTKEMKNREQQLKIAVEALKKLEIKIDWNADDLVKKEYREMELIIDEALAKI